MIVFKFSNEDLDSDLVQYFNNFEIKIPEAWDLELEDIVNYFKSFLIGMTFPLSLVKKFFEEKDNFCDKRCSSCYKDDCVDKETFKNFILNSHVKKNSFIEFPEDCSEYEHCEDCHYFGEECLSDNKDKE